MGTKKRLFDENRKKIKKIFVKRETCANT